MGTLLALRILESNRRRLYFQDLVIHEQTEQLQVESAKSERLILNILPASVAERLRNGEESIADEYPLVSVLFADIVGFTPLAARLEPRELVDMLSGLFSAFDDLVADRGLEKIKTIGDSYMAVGGLTGDATEQAVNTVSLGLAMIEEAASVRSSVNRCSSASASTPGRSSAASSGRASWPSTCGATPSMSPAGSRD